jgi:hypothetical protein
LKANSSSATPFSSCCEPNGTKSKLKANVYLGV